jgi:hypothetical protein
VQWRCGGRQGGPYASRAQRVQARARSSDAQGRARARGRVPWRGPKWKEGGGRGCGYGLNPARFCPHMRRGAPYSTLCALALAHSACAPINLLLKDRAPRRMPSRSRSKSSSRSGKDAKKKSRSRSPAAKGEKTKSRSRSPAAKGDKSRSRSPAKDAKDKEAPRKRDETPPNVKAARLTVQNLTRNVGGEHLKEIFGTFG